MSARSGKVRVARLTDLAALGELSRLCQNNGDMTRSLGLPVSGPPIGMFNLFRLPLGAFSPHDLLYVFEDDGRLSGLLRVERESHRDEWTIVELDGIGHAEAGDIRFRLVQHLLRDGGKRGRRPVPRRGGRRRRQRRAVHAGRVRPLRRGDRPVAAGRARAAGPVDRRGDGRRSGSARRSSLDSLALARLYATATPQPVQRLEALRLVDWERQGTAWRVPRSSLAPILRFADVEAYAQEAEGGGKDGTLLDGFIQVGVAKEDQPHYLKVIVRPGVDSGPLVRFGLGLIAARTTKDGGHRHDHGVIAPVRTYEHPVDRTLEDNGFEAISTVTLLMKETLVRVAEPALVPAVR